MESERVALILTPYRDELQAVIEAVKESVTQQDFVAYTSSERPGGGDLVQDIVVNIFQAELIICDLTYLNPNVLYELGVAHALSKSCVLMCSKRAAPGADSWLVNDGSTSDGPLPFDLARYQVIPYRNDAEGLKELKDRIRDRLAKSGGRRLVGPVNTALDTVFATNRTLSYMLYGGWLGALVGFAASIPTASIGRSFIWEWHKTGHVLRTLLEGGGYGAVMGGLYMMSFAIVYSHYERRHSRSWTRLPFLAAASLGGVIAGIVAVLPYVIIDIIQYGVDIALSISMPHLVLILLSGIGFGWAATIEPPLRRPERFAGHMRNAALTAILLFGGFATLVHFFRHQFFPEAYLVRYQTLDPFADSLRYALFSLGLAAAHWWLRWEKRL